MTYRLQCAAAALTIAGCNSADAPKGKQDAAEVASEMKGMNLRAGQWEATYEIVSIDGAGMPPEAMAMMKGNKTSVRNCITPEQAAKPDADFMAGQKDSKCEYRDWSMRGGKISGTMSCAIEGQGEMVMAMDGSFTRDSYDMVTEMDNPGLPDGMTMKIKSRTSGKRVGDCPAGDKI